MDAKKEEYGLVLDFLPYGKSEKTEKEPLAQVIGEAYFTLLEVRLKKDSAAAIGERLYIGGGTRDKVERIKERVAFDQLTTAAQQELPNAVSLLVKQKEDQLVKFLNSAGPISLRSHKLELLPGIGKRHLEQILGEREKKEFADFSDFNQRISHLGDVEKIFSERIVNELKGEEKYFIFTKRPHSDEEEERPKRFVRRW